LARPVPLPALAPPAPLATRVGADASAAAASLLGAVVAVLSLGALAGALLLSGRDAAAARAARARALSPALGFAAPAGVDLEAATGAAGGGCRIRLRVRG
jgi:hypothetical protein